jgi:hypothetical protein
MSNKKVINIKDLEQMKALKEGESLITKNYVITCKKFQDEYIIEWRDGEIR